MQKQISYYTSKAKKPWPDFIRKQFAKSMSKYGVIVFNEFSIDEKEFLNICSKIGLELNRKKILKCTGRDLYNYPFHYLSVPDNRKVFFRNEADYSEACKGCGKSMMRLGTIPTKKIVLNYKHLNPNNDFFYISGYSIPSIFIVSRKLKDLFESACLSGYKLAPCMPSESKDSYITEEVKIEKRPCLHNADYYQLIITEQVNQPPHCGSVTEFSSPCPICKSYNGFYVSTEPYFCKNDLKDTDFQQFNEYLSDNIGKFAMRSQREIISSKVLKILIENKIRLLGYLTDPPIKYGVVDIVD